MRRTLASMAAPIAVFGAAVSLSLLLTTGASAVTVGTAQGVKRALAETNAVEQVVRVCRHNMGGPSPPRLLDRSQPAADGLPSSAQQQPPRLLLTAAQELFAGLETDKPRLHGRGFIFSSGRKPVTGPRACDVRDASPRIRFASWVPVGDRTRPRKSGPAASSASQATRRTTRSRS